MRAILIICGIWLAGGLSCATEASAQRDLKEALFFYQRDLRWQRCSQAANRVDPELRGPFVEHCSDLAARLNIGGIDVLDVDIDESHEKATVRVRYSFLMAPSVSLENRKVTERWERKGGSWVLVEGALPLELQQEASGARGAP